MLIPFLGQRLLHFLSEDESTHPCISVRPNQATAPTNFVGRPGFMPILPFFFDLSQEQFVSFHCVSSITLLVTSRPPNLRDGFSSVRSWCELDLKNGPYRTGCGLVAVLRGNAGFDHKTRHSAPQGTTFAVASLETRTFMWIALWRLFYGCRYPTV